MVFIQVSSFQTGSQFAEINHLTHITYIIYIQPIQRSPQSRTKTTEYPNQGLHKVCFGHSVTMHNIWHTSRLEVYKPGSLHF